MKDKLFIYIITGFILLMMVSAPVTYFFVSTGIIEHENLGNIISSEKTYEENQFLSAQLTAIENVKSKLIDIYTNYIPGYASIITNAGTIKIKLNQPIYSLYASIIAEQYASTMTATEILDAYDTGVIDANLPSLNDTESEMNEIVRERLSSENAPVIPSIGIGAGAITDSSSSFIRNELYRVDVTFEDGTQTGFLTVACRDNSLNQYAVNEINRLAQANNDVHFYVYVCTRFQDSEFFSDYVLGTRSTKPFLDEFLDMLNPSIKYDYQRVDSLEESIQKLFLTDHHWSAYGAYEGYYDIITMMAEDSPVIGPPKPIGTLHVIEDATFYGTHARGLGYRELTDTLYFYEYDLPQHEIKTTEDYIGFDNIKNRYLNGIFSKSLGTDHYINFYPYTSYTKYPENNTGRNLLMLTDSYNRGMTELLGSNFDETFVFDFRFMHHIGDYNKFIETNNITDVLVMQYSFRLLFNWDANFLHLIKTN